MAINDENFNTGSKPNSVEPPEEYPNPIMPTETLEDFFDRLHEQRAELGWETIGGPQSSIPSELPRQYRRLSSPNPGQLHNETPLSPVIESSTSRITPPSSPPPAMVETMDPVSLTKVRNPKRKAEGEFAPGNQDKAAEKKRKLVQIREGEGSRPAPDHVRDGMRGKVLEAVASNHPGAESMKAEYDKAVRRKDLRGKVLEAIGSNDPEVQTIRTKYERVFRQNEKLLDAGSHMSPVQITEGEGSRARREGGLMSMRGEVFEAIAADSTGREKIKADYERISRRDDRQLDDRAREEGHERS